MPTRFINPVPQFIDLNGNPDISYTLTFYETGTLTLKDTYSDVDLSVANENPLTLNSLGSAPTEIWLGEGAYRAILRTPSGGTVWDRDPLDDSAITPVASGEGIIFAADFGVVADSTPTVSGTDNADAIASLIQFLADNSGVTVIWPQDPTLVIGFTGYLQFSHCTNIRHVFGSPLRNTGSWNAGGATVSFGQDVFINHLAGVNPEISRQYPYPIATVLTGNASVTLTTVALAADFPVGGWALVTGYDTQGGGFPPNLRYNEYRRVVSANISTGAIVLDKPLSYSYYSTWYPTSISGTPVGPAGIQPLDRGVNFVFCEYMQVENLTVLYNPSETPSRTDDGENSYNSNTVQINGTLYAKFTNLKCSTLYTGECETVILDNPTIVYFEPDKLQNKLIINGGVITTLNQGTGVDYIEANGTIFKYSCAPISKNFLARNCQYLGLTAPAGFNLSRYQQIHTYEDNLFNYTAQTSVITGFTPTESVGAPDKPGNVEVTVLATPSGTTFTVTFGTGEFRINAGIGTILTRPSDMATFEITNIAYNGTNHLVTYASPYTVVAADILYYYTQRVLRMTGNARLGQYKRLPWLSLKRFSDVYINEGDGILEKNYELVLRDFPPASATNNLYEIDGILREIEVVVISAYGGGGDNRIQISAWTPNGSTFPTETINSAAVGQRFITAAAIVNNNGGAAPAGESLTAFGYNRYIGVINVRPLAADNPGALGWDGYIRIKATRR